MKYRPVQMKYFTFLLLAIFSVVPARAQLVEPNQIGLRMGLVHLAVKDLDAQKHFWVSIMGGTIVKNGGLELIQFPGVYILLSQSDAATPPAGSIVNHFGLVVKDMPATLAKWKDANLQIQPTANPNEAFVLAPDGIRVEVYGEPSLPTPVSMNHIHFYLIDIPGIKSWYVKAFGANPGRRPCIACIAKPSMTEADDLPGVNLSFSASTAPPGPMKGRSIDYIGFEVTNLEAFVKGLETRGIKIDGPIRTLPDTTIKSAFLTDPFGTSIELTEGLAPQ